MNDTRLAHLRRFAHWMDDGIRLPGTQFRIGLDPIIGLIPGLGDAAGAALAAWILVEAGRLGASRATLTRIATNIALDALIGAVPLLGDVFDAVSKANLRNIELLQRHDLDPVRAHQADRLFLLLLGGTLLLFCAAIIVGGALLARGLIQAVTAH